MKGKRVALSVGLGITLLAGAGRSPDAGSRDTHATVMALPSIAPVDLGSSVSPPRSSNQRIGRCGAGPTGYRLKGGYPSRKGFRNPQDAALYLQKVLGGRSYSHAKRICLLSRAADAVIASGVRRNGGLLFPYDAPYEMGAAGTLTTPWFSGLAQTTMMGSLLSISRLTGNTSYERDARAAFEPLLWKRDAGGFLDDIGDGAWIQEYPSDVPTYVLNGHPFSIMSARSFSDVTGDARGRELFRKGVDATLTLLPLFDIQTPAGPVGAYDLLRRQAGAPLRTRGVEIIDAAFVDAAGSVVARPDGAVMSRGQRVQYPVSVVAVPRIFLRVSYRGDGRIEIHDGRRWTSLAMLADASDPVTIEIPQRFQGRTINRNYHAIHVDLLRRLAHATANPAFTRWADRWSPAR